MQAIFAGLGIAYTASWLRSRNDDELYAGALLLGANMWCRNEGIVFIGAACAILLIDCIRRKSYRKGLYFTGLSLLPAIIWFIYMKIGGLYTEGMAITRLFWDGKRLLGFVYQSHILWLDILGIRHFYSREQLVHD